MKQPTVAAQLIRESAEHGMNGYIPQHGVGKWFVPRMIDHLSMRTCAKILGTSREMTFHLAIKLLAEKINKESEASGSPLRVDIGVFESEVARRDPRLFKRDDNAQEVIRYALEQRFSPEDLGRLGYRFEARQMDPVSHRDLMRSAITGNRPSPSQQARGGRPRRAERAGEAGDHEPGHACPGGVAGNEEAKGGK